MKAIDKAIEKLCYDGTTDERERVIAMYCPATSFGIKIEKVCKGKTPPPAFGSEITGCIECWNQEIPEPPPMKAIDYAMMLHMLPDEKPKDAEKRKMDTIKFKCPDEYMTFSDVEQLCGGDKRFDVTGKHELCTACWNQEIPDKEKELDELIRETAKVFKKALDETPLMFVMNGNVEVEIPDKEATEKAEEEAETACSEQELEKHIQELIDSVKPELIPDNLTMQERLNFLFMYLNYFDRRNTTGELKKKKAIEAEIEKLLLTDEGEVE